MISAARIIDNYGDTGRKEPELAGLTLEKIAGPGTSGVVSLSRPALSISAVMSYITASGDLVAVEGAPNIVSAFKLEGTHFSAVLNDPITGVAKLTETAAVDNSANTWVVLYTPLTANPPQGGNSSLIP